MSKDDNNNNSLGGMLFKGILYIGGAIVTAYTTHKLVDGNTRGKAMKKALKENNPEDEEWYLLS